MIAGCKYVRWINTQEEATSFIREVKTGLHLEQQGWLDRVQVSDGETPMMCGLGQLWAAGARNIMERSPWGDSFRELFCLHPIEFQSLPRC